MEATSEVAVDKLIATHSQTMSRNALQKLVNNIAENGIKETVKYVENNGLT